MLTVKLIAPTRADLPKPALLTCFGMIVGIGDVIGWVWQAVQDLVLKIGPLRSLAPKS